MLQELSAVLISQWKKEQLREALKAVRKTINDADRAKNTALAEKVYN